MTNLIYLFDVILTNGKIFFFTSSSQYQFFEENTYVPQSGLNFNIGEFNDSAENSAIIYGIFETNGICKNDNLSGAKIKIKYLYANNAHLIGNFIVTKFFSHDLEFELKCETECIKYNQALLQMFSKTCRANFGDDRCKIRLEDVSIQSQIIEVNNNIITCDFRDIEDGYFKNGKLIINDAQNTAHEYNIISHFRNNIETNITSTSFIFSKQIVTLIPGCDKNYRTCCYSFHNAVNFRGEPVIPEFNIIEN
ncbi:MAG: DUF2163 domain-containing protein [Rickettsiales bacterium]|nr:MAG: DUF2163 domain-containing protein [Rickettsiales bacterium]